MAFITNAKFSGIRGGRLQGALSQQIKKAGGRNSARLVEQLKDHALDTAIIALPDSPQQRDQFLRRERDLMCDRFCLLFKPADEPVEIAEHVLALERRLVVDVPSARINVEFHSLVQCFHRFVEFPRLA
jgi:hypothetical protein